MNFKHPIFVVFFASILLLQVGFLYSFESAEAQELPNWIKQTAGWWAEGKVSDTEFLRGIQYLVDNKIIKLKSTETSFTSQFEHLVLQKKYNDLSKQYEEKSKALQAWKDSHAELKSNYENLKENRQKWVDAYNDLYEKTEQFVDKTQFERTKLQEQFQEQTTSLTKSNIEEQAKTNPILKGIINGEIKFYISPLPSYADPSIQEPIDLVSSALDGWKYYGATVKRVYDANQADIVVKWTKDFGRETIGHALFRSHVEVSLGKDSCDNQWYPFDRETVRRILWHELGHTFGYGHSEKPDNIMYSNTNTRFLVDREFSGIISDGWTKYMTFCQAGKVGYNITTEGENDAFSAWVIPPNQDPKNFLNNPERKFYADCSKEHMKSLGRSCTVEQGSKLLIHNYKDHPIKVNVVMKNFNSHTDVNTSWDPDAFRYDKEKLNAIWNLYH